MDAFERRNLFNKAADLLETEGWVEGAMCECTDRGESYCMIGALRMVKYGSPYPDDITPPDHDTEEPGNGESYGGISADRMMTWNDTYAGSVRVVVQRLRQMGAGDDFSDHRSWLKDPDA